MINRRSFNFKWLAVLVIFLAACLLLIILGVLSSARSNQISAVDTEIVTTFTALARTRTRTSMATSTPSPTITRTPEPTSTFTPSPTFTNTPDAWIEDQLGRMSLEQKVGQMMMSGVSGQVENSSTCDLIRQLSPGAVVLTKSNVSTPGQLRAFLASLQDCAQAQGSLPLITAVDHEGQYVDRFDSGVTLFPPAMAIGASGDSSLAYRVALASGQELAYSGVNMVLGPVADVLLNYDNTVISQRSFGGDANIVGEFVAKAVSGYQQAGIIPVLKHFPGHGGTAQDSHITLPVDEATREQLDATYLVPFQQGIAAGARVVMVSHVAFPAIDESGKPASLSEPMIGLLRHDLGFQGVVLTDSLGMGAITGQGLSIPDASIQAVAAGEDMLLISDPTLALAARNRLVEAVQSGKLEQGRVDDAVRHILSLKASAGLSEFPVAAGPAPDWEANKALAQDAGSQSVVIFRDQAGLIPIPTDLKNILVVGPTDGWGMYPILLARINGNSRTVKVITYTSPWAGAVPETSYLKTIPDRAGNYDLIIVLTWEAHVNHIIYQDEWQAKLVKNLLDTGTPIIVAALKSPTDMLEFPDVKTYLATFGTTRGQLEMLADTLLGVRQASGVNPLPGLR